MCSHHHERLRGCLTHWYSGWVTCFTGAQEPARPDIFDLSVHKLSLLYDDVVEVSGVKQTDAYSRSTSGSHNTSLSSAPIDQSPKPTPR